MIYAARKSESDDNDDSTEENIAANPPTQNLNMNPERHGEVVIPFVEWIYPDGRITDEVTNAREINTNDRIHEINSQVPDGNIEYIVNPTDTIVSPTVVIDGVIVPKKRCFFKWCGVTLCDDSFPCSVNPKFLPCIVSVIIIGVAMMTVITIHWTKPSPSNPTYSVSIAFIPSQNPTNAESFSPSHTPTIYPSMSPSYQCILKYPNLNGDLIGDGVCNGGEYFDEDCGHDGGDCIPSLQLLGKAYGGGFKWNDCVLGSDGRIYGIPYFAESFFKFDPMTNETSLIGANLGNKKWITAILGRDKKIYGVPYNAKSILKYDAELNSFSFIANENELLSGKSMFHNAVQAQNGNIYFIPYDHNKVLVFNNSNIDNPLSEKSYDLGWDNSKSKSGVLGNDGNIYVIPFSANRVLRISTLDDTISFIGGVYFGSFKWSHGVLAKNGNIYACPFQENYVLKINTTDQTTHLVGFINEYGDKKWNAFVEGADGLLYGIPCNSNKLLIFDPDTETATIVQLDDKYGVGFQKWSSGVLASNGVIYAIPYHSKHQILAIVPK